MPSVGTERPRAQRTAEQRTAEQRTAEQRQQHVAAADMARRRAPPQVTAPHAVPAFAGAPR